MIEKILDFLTSKDSIENSKITRAFSYLLIGILSSSWYSYSFHKYTLNFDYKFLADFILSGEIIPCIILYGLVYSVGEFITAMLYMIYSFTLYAKIKNKADEAVKIEGKTKIKRDYIQIRDFFKPLLISGGALLVVKNEIRMHKEVKIILERYCNEPRTIVVNLIQLLVLLTMSYLAYYININDLTYIPCWFNWLVNIIFWLAVFLIPVFIIILSILEVNISGLRIICEKVKSIE
ncbi:MAG TPA: hypothetical protein VKG26_02975 [Bacteroidia bacterium]|nr:hypothetical protein [Bacteroidia bacterium]